MPAEVSFLRKFYNKKIEKKNEKGNKTWKEGGDDVRKRCNL